MTQYIGKIRESDSLGVCFHGMYFDVNGMSDDTKYGKMKQYIDFMKSLGIVDEIAEGGMMMSFNNEDAGSPPRIMVQVTGTPTGEYVNFRAFALGADECNEMVDEFSKMTGLKEYDVSDEILERDREDTIQGSQTILDRTRGV